VGNTQVGRSFAVPSFILTAIKCVMVTGENRDLSFFLCVGEDFHEKRFSTSLANVGNGFTDGLCPDHVGGRVLRGSPQRQTGLRWKSGWAME